MNVKQLRDLIAHLPGDLPVAVEVTFNDSDDFEGAELHSANIETRCDEVERLYLWGDQDESIQEEEEEATPRKLKLVT